MSERTISPAHAGATAPLPRQGGRCGTPPSGAVLWLSLWFVVTSLALPARAQWVSVDPDFPAGSGPDMMVRTLAVDSIGRVLIGGMFTNVNGEPHPLFTRITPEGTVDPTFNTLLNAWPARIQPLSEGGLLISGAFTNVNGTFRPGLARLLDDGSPDPTFVPPALPNLDSQLYGLAGPGDRVWVTGGFTNLAGWPRNRVARLLPDGSVDPEFTSPFAADQSVTLHAIQPDGKAIFSGSFSNVAGVYVTNLVRLNLDGSPDPAYQSGIAPGERVSRALLQRDGKLLAATSLTYSYGLTINQPRLVRLHADGSLDSTFMPQFESPGLIWSGAVYGLAEQPNGKILLAGTFLRVNGVPRAKLARLLPDGSVDFCFDVALSNELVPLTIGAAPDGTVIVGGSFTGLQGQSHPNLLRLVPPADCDPGIIQVAVPTLQASRSESRVVVPVVRHGAAHRAQRVEFTTLDGSARGGTDFETTSGTVWFQPGDRSQFLSIPLIGAAGATVPKSFEVRLTNTGDDAMLGPAVVTAVTLTPVPAGTAGTPDTHFVVTLDGPVTRILPLSSGGAYILGAFTNINGIRCPTLARLNADGSLDPGFARPQAVAGEVRDLALEPSGKVLLVGYFERIDGVWKPGLARLETDGSLDLGFGPLDTWPTNQYGGAEMESVAVLADGSIICGGYVPDDTYYSREVLLKFSPSGVLDAAFASRVPTSLAATRLAPLPGSGILVLGGGFGSTVVKLESDGRLNLGFIPPADYQFTYYSGQLSVLPDGRVVVMGAPSAFYGLPGLPAVWRLNPDGSLDRGFDLNRHQNSGAQPPVWGEAMASLADGRVLLAGTFSTNSAIKSVRRFRADGLVDPSFDAGTGFMPLKPGGDTYVNAIASLPSGGWLVGGEFGGFDGFPQHHLVKLQTETLSRPLTFSLAVANITLLETNAQLKIDIQRSGDASGPAQVTVRTQGGTAVAGQDFASVTTNLMFAPGEWSKTVLVEVYDDALVEAAEQFTLELTAPTGGFSLAAPATVTVTLQDNDAGIEFTSDLFRGVEEEGYALVSAKWSGAVASNLTATVNIVPVVGNAADLGLSSVTLQYGNGTRWNSNTVRIPILDNAHADGTRTFRLELSGAPPVNLGPRATAFLLLEDRDFATVPARGVAGIIEALAPAPGGGVYLAGDFTGVHGVPRNHVARLLPNGEVDLAFDPSAGPNARVSALAVQPDGRVLISGSFSTIDGIKRTGLARLNPDGSLDPSFDVGLGVQSTNRVAHIRVLLPDADGRVYLAGDFTHINQRPRRAIARLLPAGSLDESFNSPFIDSIWIYPRPYPLVNAVAVLDLVQQPDGKLLAATLPQRESYLPSQSSISRLELDGRLDTNFTKVIATARCLALRSEGRILFGGLGSTNWLPISRVNTNGTPDTTFQVRNVPPLHYGSSEVRQLHVLPDGRVLFCTTLFRGRDDELDRAIIGRLQADGAWDSTFQPVICEIPLLREPGPYWFNDPVPPITALKTSYPPVTTATFAVQPDGVLVLGGAFDAINDEPRHRLARIESHGALRGRLKLEMAGPQPLRLQLPAEAEVPYLIETSTDLIHWSSWLVNQYPWWPVELLLPAEDGPRFFRARTPIVP